jgi:hypothetical protein
MTSWEKFIKRYIWDDERTPYFVPATRLTRLQADYEIFAFTLFLGILFGLVGLVALVALPGVVAGRGSEAVALYAFTVVCASIIFGMTKAPLAGYWCAGASLAGTFIYLISGFGAGLGWIDHVLIIGVMAVWLRYSQRIATVARRYADLPEAERQP